MEKAQVCDEQPIRQCPYCDAPLTHPRRVQCGRADCKKQFNADRMREYMRRRRNEPGDNRPKRTASSGKKITISCTQCGQLAQVTKRTAKYCSHECSYDARFGADRPKDRYAGLTKAEQNAAVRARRRGETKRRKAAERLRRARVGARGSGVLCAGLCVRCGESFVRRCTTPTGHCSLQCWRRDRAATRRALRREAGAAVSRWRVFERDRWTCHICGDPVDRSATVPDLAAPTLDHVLPIARGGDHSEANLRTAHFYCNSVKGDLVEGWSLLAG